MAENIPVVPSTEQGGRATIVIGGDFCPSGVTEQYLIDGNAKGVFNDLLNEFENADYSVVNLECPITEKVSPIVKTGNAFRMDPDCINGFKQSHIRAVNLANNHIMDHGVTGLEDTIDICRRNGIETFGAGNDLEQAGSMLIREINGLRFGFLGMAQHEFSIAARNGWGANPMDPIGFVRRVRTGRQQIDYLIVLLHAGAEYYPYPSPGLQKMCRFFVEEGANVVICQHSHCAGSIEWYNKVPVVYGQGNLLAERLANRHVDWHRGFLLRLVFTLSEVKMDILPYMQSFDTPGIRSMNEAEEQEFRQSLDDRSKSILDGNFVAEKWMDFCRSREAVYLSTIRGHNRLLRRLNAHLNFSTRFYSMKSIAGLLNTLRCEIHREILITLLDSIMKESTH
jgi:poly-gamma-glutamate synthesis protein (capsule biosynthesis protein)